jgi:hypothetical protein
MGVPLAGVECGIDTFIEISRIISARSCADEPDFIGDPALGVNGQRTT